MEEDEGTGAPGGAEPAEPPPPPPPEAAPARRRPARRRTLLQRVTEPDPERDAALESEVELESQATAEATEALSEDRATAEPAPADQPADAATDDAGAEASARAEVAEGHPALADAAADDDVPDGHAWFRASAAATPADPELMCRFLAAQDVEGSIGPAIPMVDGSNRCVAVGEPAPQSASQQELLCLTGAHVNCPRYLRGLLIETTPPPLPRREPISSAVIVSVLVLVAAIAASFGFLAVRGGLGIALATDGGRASQVALAPSVSLLPSVGPDPSVGPSPATPSPTPAASPSPTVSPPASAAPTPSPTPRPTPKPTPTPRPTSDRFAVLTPCPSTPGCWVYVIRSGDNLVSIAHWFGVSLDRIYAMNPWARTTGLKAGQELRIPTPTR